MKFRTALVAFAFACDGDLTTKPSGDTGLTGNCGAGGAYNGPLNITGAEVTCPDDEARLTVETEGLTGGGRVFMQETGSELSGQWAENHTLDTYSFDSECKTFDKLERFLDDGTTLADPTNDYQNNVSSVFTCGGHFNDNGFMTFAFSVDDLQGNQAACLAFGDDVNGMKGNDYNIVGEDPDFDLGDCVEGQEGL